jgi:DNA-binding response OmpR family regulator
MPEFTVVLVDDEEEFVSTLAERLELRGLRATATTDGEQGLAAITRFRPRVAVVDVKMPGIDGMTLLQRIKELSPGTQVILLTGHASTQNGIRGTELGAFDYMTKPVAIEVLLDQINKAAGSSRVGDDDPGTTAP